MSTTRLKLLTAFAAAVTLSAAASPALGAAFLPLCERTTEVQAFIVADVNERQHTTKTCAEITEADLQPILRVSIAFGEATALKVGDFSGLPNLEILNIRSNPYTELPESLFAGLSKLKTLVIIDTPLRHFPDDFLADTPYLENCHCFENQVRSISESVFQRLQAMESIKILDLDVELQDAERARLEALYSGNDGVELSFY